MEATKDLDFMPKKRKRRGNEVAGSSKRMSESEVTSILKPFVPEHRTPYTVLGVFRE